MQNTDRIQVAISPAVFTGHHRQAQHLAFIVNERLDMIQQVRVLFCDAAGTPIHDLIDADETLTADQKALAKAQYPERIVQKTTAGAWVNPATGAVVEEGTEGAVPQLQFFQNITVEQMLTLTGSTKKDSFAKVLYTMLAGEIQKTDQRGQL